MSKTTSEKLETLRREKKFPPTSPVGRLSFPALVKPTQYSEANPLRYEVTLVFTPEDQKTAGFKALMDAVKLVAKAAFGDDASKVLKQQEHKPFRNADEKFPTFPEGSVYIHAKTKNKPKVVDRFLGPDKKPRELDDNEILEKMYGGAYARANLEPYAQTDKNKGVYWSLGPLQFWDHGERLGGSTASPEDAFDFEAPEDADLSDVQDEPLDDGDDDISDLIG